MPIALTLYAVIVIREEAPGSMLEDYAGTLGFANPNVRYGLLGGPGRSNISHRSNGSNGNSLCDLQTVRSEAAGRGKLPPLSSQDRYLASHTYH